MLDYAKTILTKVSFDEHLFRKELAKSLKWLRSDEVVLLRHWTLQVYGTRYRNVIQETFYRFQIDPVEAD